MALGAFNLMLAQSPPDTSPLASASAAEISAATPQNEPDIARRNFAITHTRNRPLFVATRRAYVAPPKPPPPKQQVQQATPVQPAPAPPTPPPDVRLFGVEITPSGNRALVSHGNQATAEWLSEGADIRGWSLSTVEGDRIVLIREEQRQIVDLYPPDG
ncbi:hypothetical protein [Oricola cellulosilytica]|uniref:Type II secretion system protein GspC N-terminal domain-containing protein n=1 Tax=Oricola cellulosilytica TaxID=1429082 RepID=A0A4R0PK09_9HYPH|nr:hypothetical protein [Oricola cellulosilytica]TCD16660.1 hypothetical protein E0D97_04410 [Oricola cellulosilytica]